MAVAIFMPAARGLARKSLCHHRSSITVSARFRPMPMRPTRPSFSVPVICIDDFLSEEDAAKVLAECLDLRKVYVPGRVFDGSGATSVDVTHRRNDAVSLDEVFRGAPERSDVLRILKARIWTDECRSLWHEGYLLFDVINYSTWHECVVSRYANGDFFAKHRDTRRDHITYRLVTIVYYVADAERTFGGGALVLWDGERSLRIEPSHNRAVVFPSFTFHEVEQTIAVGSRWEDARFSVNYWIGFR